MTLAGLTDRYPDLAAFGVRIGRLVNEGYFQRGSEILVNRTPGRLDLMGGNDDYTGGFVLQATIKESTRVAVQPRSDQTITFYNPGVTSLGWKERIDLGLPDLIENGQARPLSEIRSWISADSGRAWCAYVLGDVYFLIRTFPDRVKHGFNLYLESDVPLGKGVSSSAALEVAPMKALARMYGLEAEGVELASWTQWVEIALTGAACGIMDQMAVVLGDEGFLMPMLCQPCLPRPLVRLPENLRLWGIDSGVRHSVAGLEYESARAATFMGYRLMCEAEGLEPSLDESGALPRWVDPKWNGYLANVRPSEFRRRYESCLPEAITGSEFSRPDRRHLDPYTEVRSGVSYPVRAATRYAVEENWRVQAFFALISRIGSEVDQDTTRLLGELMHQSHAAYSECGLGSPATDKLVELAGAEQGAGLYGAKITGGGAGGTVAVLGEDSPAARLAIARVVDRYAHWSGGNPYVFEGSSPGADRFGVPMACY